MRRAIAIAAAAALLVGAAPAAAKTVTYEGETKAGTSVTLKRSGGKVTKLLSTVPVVCTSAQTSQTRAGVELYKPPVPIRLGSKAKAEVRQESALWPGSPTKYYTTEIDRKGKRLKGTLSISLSYYVPDLYYPKIFICSGGSKFSAKPK